ncbi:discoidin domain-containing protein [Paenibacillus sp. GCM10027628]|uniref:discoidin domain-containing protein n=1 Tax=Paenibacillus sp. GCM10027628 TaxID=3273413 RepID=UPI003640EF36
MKKWFVLFVMLCMIVTMRIPSPASAAGTTYYVDSVNGDDANSGTDTSSAWRSLAKINATVFNPGDTILFKTGGIWNGQLSPKGSGVNGSPIVIDMYGTGSKPVINGGGLNNTGTVYLVNQEYWEINHLEVTNDDNMSANDTADVRMGIYYKIDANVSGNNHVFSHIYIRNCYIHDVDGNENGSAASAGISGEIVGPNTASSARFDDIRIENNTLTKVDRTAIQPNKLNIFTCPGTDTCFRDGVRNNNQWGTGFHVAYNTMSDIGGDGILMRETKDAIVEHNVLSSFGTRALTTTAIAGIWLWNANHTIFQFNEVYGGPAANQDGCAFDFDYYGIDNVYQYNYSHDNPMGAVLLMGANENDIFRYNISQNDGLAFRHFAYDEKTSAYFYNNIFYYDGANHKINGDDTTQLGYHFYNNIFYNKSTTTPTKWGNGNWDQLTFSHNIFYEASGQHTQQEPFDPYGMTNDPKFVNPGSGSIGLDTLNGYKLQADSPAIDAGIESPQAQGIKDFYGKLINASKPDIGVQELTGTPSAAVRFYVPQQQMSAVATSSTTGHSPASVIDGQDQTYWQSEDGSNPSLTIALGRTYKIDRVFYVPSAEDTAGVITNYQVYTSTDGVAFTKVATGKWANNTYMKRAMFPSVTASYIKIIALHSSGHTSAAEVQVGIGTGTDGAGLYTGIPQSSMTATASSIYSSSYAAAKAIDGSTSTYWYPSSLPTAANPQYIILTLNQKYTISKFDYKPYSGAYAVTAYKLYVSTDGVNFTAIPTGTGNPGTWAADSSMKVATFDPVEATAFKFEMTATGGNRPAVLELNLYSPDNLVPVPAQPTHLTASPADSQVNLMWSSVTDATYYNVKRSPGSGGPYMTIATNVTGATYADTGLTNGTAYYYVVTAANSGGESSNSKEVNASPVQAPTAPTSLTALAGNAQVSLAWNTVTGATYYNVKRSTSSGGPYMTIAANVTGATYADTGLVNGSTYYYVVTAANTGGESAISNAASASPAEPLSPVQAPTAPTSLTALAGNAQVSLAWSTVTGATYYNVKRSTSSGGSYRTIATNVTGATYSDTGLVNGITYYYVVTAANAGGESVNSTVVGATPISSSNNQKNSSSDTSTTTTAGPSVVPTKDGVQINIQPVSDKTADGTSVAKVTIDGATLAQVMELLKASTGTADQRIIIEVKGSEAVGKVELPAASMAELLSKVPAAVLSFKYNGATYDLPLKVVDISGLATALGSATKDLIISTSIEKVSSTTSVDIETKAKQAGLKPITSAIDFSVTAEANGKQVSLNDFGKTYVTRTMEITKEVDAKKTTVVLYNPATGTLSFVPATFSASDGITKASIKRPGNSIYTVVESDKTFEDLKGQWSQADVELLSSKLVINGMTESSFAPQKEITRSQFAALLVRALGLSETNAAQFTDVKTNDWFAGAIGAASKAGLVDGFENGTFQPDANITREQMAVMITRAMNFAGKKAAADVKGLAGFTDAVSISEWAKDAVSQSVNAGIINGVTDHTFVPSAKASRAEAAVMLKRLLQYEQFIN